jgi:hypothetical protein
MHSIISRKKWELRAERAVAAKATESEVLRILDVDWLESAGGNEIEGRCEGGRMRGAR